VQTTQSAIDAKTRSTLFQATICGGVVALGSLLTWVSAPAGEYVNNGSGVPTTTASGISGAGKITIVCGLIALYCGVRALYLHQVKLRGVLLGAIASVVAVYIAIHDSTTYSNEHAGVGIGLWLVLIGSVVGLIEFGRSGFSMRRPAQLVQTALPTQAPPIVQVPPPNPTPPSVSA
jgi:hypothetical protein